MRAGRGPRAPERRRIVHATDFSPASAAAFRTAVAWARRRRAELTLLHVLSYL